jgi:hypothetical protein
MENSSLTTSTYADAISTFLSIFPALAKEEPIITYETDIKAFDLIDTNYLFFLNSCHPCPTDHQ